MWYYTRLQKVSGFSTRKVVQINLLISCFHSMIIISNCLKLSMWNVDIWVQGSRWVSCGNLPKYWRWSLEYILALIGLKLLKLLMSLAFLRLVFLGWLGLFYTLISMTILRSVLFTLAGFYLMKWSVWQSWGLSSLGWLGLLWNMRLGHWQHTWVTWFRNFKKSWIAWIARGWLIFGDSTWGHLDHCAPLAPSLRHPLSEKKKWKLCG